MRRIAAATLVLTLSLTTSCAVTKPTMLDGESVEVGVTADQPGTGYAGPDGRFRGFDVSVTARLLSSKEIGVVPNFHSLKPAMRASALLSGQVDLVAASYSITPERMRPVSGGPGLDFVGPYATTRQGLLVRKRESDSYKDIDDFLREGRVICVVGSTTAEVALESFRSGKVSMLVLEEVSDCLTALREGRVSAVAADQMVLYGIIGENQHFVVLRNQSFSYPSDYGIAMLKSNREDCEKLRDALKSYVLSADWERDFRRELPAVPDAERDRSRPTSERIDALSCRDEPGHPGVG